MHIADGRREYGGQEIRPISSKNGTYWGVNWPTAPPTDRPLH